MLVRPVVIRYPTAGAKGMLYRESLKYNVVDTKRGAWFDYHSIRQRKALQATPGLFRTIDPTWRAILQTRGVIGMSMREHDSLGSNPM